MWRTGQTNERKWGAVGQLRGDVAEGQAPLREIVIFGHSYVNHLQVRDPIIGQGLFLRCLGRGGAKVATIRSDGIWERLLRDRPALTFLVLGGNDITPESDLVQLAQDIEDLAKEIEDKTGGHCKIVGVEKRTNPRGMSSARFNAARNGVNRRLKRQLKFARTRYMSMEMNEQELWDGVHLKREANDRLLSLLVTKACEHFQNEA